MAITGRGLVLVENLIALIVISIGALIIWSGVLEGERAYIRMRARYMAELTAENVYHILLSNEDVPKNMNGFDVSYKLDGEVLEVRVGKFKFVYSYGGRK